MTDKEQKQEANTEDLIGQLCGELEPVSKCCPYKNMLLWLSLSVLYIVGIIYYLGVSVNLETYLQSASFLFEMGIVISILVTSAIASSFLSFPDAVQKGWVKVVALTLFSCFLLWIFANVVEEGFDMSVFQIGSCYRGMIIEVIPFIALILLTIKGKSTQPYWLMTMNVFAVSALGWIGLRLTCSMYDSMIYGFVHYLLPFTILGAAVGFFARKIFKW